MYTFEQLKADVKTEADNLKVHATKEELGMLELEELHPEETANCIYGQMTGFCHSKRAVDLIQSCACRFIKDGALIEIVTDGFKRIQSKVNGEKVNNLHDERVAGNLIYHYSAIEAYILLPEAKNANLIAYLKGETETLEL